METRAYLNFFTLTFRALGRNHIVLTPLSDHYKFMESSRNIRLFIEQNNHIYLLAQGASFLGICVVSINYFNLSFNKIFIYKKDPSTH